MKFEIQTAYLMKMDTGLKLLTNSDHCRIISSIDIWERVVKVL
jgi:hypothetical protein